MMNFRSYDPDYTSQGFTENQGCADTSPNKRPEPLFESDTHPQWPKSSSVLSTARIAEIRKNLLGEKEQPKKAETPALPCCYLRR